MCGRYTFVDLKELPIRFGITEELPKVAASYNVAPGSLMPVVVRQSPPRVELMKWGLIPSWSRDLRMGMRMINARIETVAVKPSYRKSLSRRRCLVPANGFYEWKKSGVKQPYYFRLKDKTLMAFAGLWDEWRDAEDHPIRSYTILTTKAVGKIANIHERMPVMLTRASEQKWINPEIVEGKKALEVIEQRTLDELELYPVDVRVNKATENDEGLIEPVDGT
jgi:putative SOS response-associated peptidase YedK